MKLKELIEEDLLSGVKYIAGENGNYRTIKTVQTIETTQVDKYHQADMLYLLDNNEMLKNNEKMTKLITQLVESHAAGIVIMENQAEFLTYDLLELAERLAFPLIKMPNLFSFSDGMQLFFEAMLQQQTGQLRKIIQSNQDLADLVLKHPKVEAVLTAGSKIMDTPIVLLNSHFQVAVASQELHGQENALTKFFRETRIDYFSLEKRITVEMGDDDYTLFPLFPAFKENKAFVGVKNYRDTDEFRIILQQLIMNTLSFVNSQIDMLKESDFRNLSGFFLNVLDGGVSKELLEKRLLEMNLNPNTKYTAIMTNVISVEPSKMVNYHILEQVQQLVTWFINEYDLPAIVFSWRQRLILLLDSSENEDHFVTALQEFISDKTPDSYQFLIGYSKSSATIENLIDIFKESREASRTVEQDPALKIRRYQPKYVQELLSLIPHDESSDFTDKFLAPLLKMDNVEEREALISTLEQYFYYHQQLAQVARSMFVHRNTIIYRIKKVEDLLGVDLSDPQTAQNVQFALWLHKAN